MDEVFSTKEEAIKAYIDALREKNESRMRSIYPHLEPVDVSVELENDPDLIPDFCSLSDDHTIAEVLMPADETVQKKILRNLDDYRVLYIFNFMPKDEITDALGLVSDGRRGRLLNKMREGDQVVIKQLLGYDEDTAGGIMTTEFLAMHGTDTVGRAIEKIRNGSSKIMNCDDVFIIDDTYRLKGIAMLKDILLATDETELINVCDTEYISCSPDTDQEEVSRLVSKYDLKAIPVINSKGIMLGIITVDDVIDVIEEEHTEDMYGMAGVSKEEDLNTTVGESVRLRLPWLVINLLTAFIAAFVVREFEGTIAKVVALSATMSIITGMGGNAGTQTLSIMIRSIALDKVRDRSKIAMLAKETALGLLDGAAVGLIAGAVIALIYHNFYLGVITFIAMILNMIIAGITGVVIPLALEKLHLDPALASSIFLTTATDTLGFFIFLGL
ncbi:MAG: magnesium transporter, partial [Anaerovoracaceae bacterium]